MTTAYFSDVTQTLPKSSQS